MQNIFEQHVFWVFLLLIIISYGVSWLVFHCIKNKRTLQDQLNTRKLHKKITPRGGGIGFVLLLTLFFTWMLWFDYFSVYEWILIALLPLLMAMLGLIDDLYNISFKLRLFVQCLIALVCVVMTKGVVAIDVGFMLIGLDYFSYVIGILIIVWMTNLVNFMDGADGFVVSQFIFAGIVMGLIFLFLGNEALSVINLAIAFVLLGFFPWNFPQAKMFMGDVGSYYLGCLFAIIAVISENEHVLPGLVIMLIFGFFVCDATFTLLKRIINGKSWSEAHHDHLYQRLVRGGLNHFYLLVILLIFNVIFIVSLVILSLVFPTYLLFFVTCCVALYIITWLIHKKLQAI